MTGIVTCCKLHESIAYIGDPLADMGVGCPLCASIEAGRSYKDAVQEKDIDMQEIRAVINDCGDKRVKRFYGNVHQRRKRSKS